MILKEIFQLDSWSYLYAIEDDEGVFLYRKDKIFHNDASINLASINKYSANKIIKRCFTTN